MSAAEERLQKQSARNGWLLSAPALLLLMVAAIGPLFIIIIYSFLTPGQYGNVVWEFSWDGWVSMVFTRDIFDGTLGLADAHLSIFWRSVKLSLMTTAVTFALGFPTAWFIATRPAKQRGLWLFLITIPFWTNLLIRTFAIMEVIRTEGVLNTFLLWTGVINEPLAIIYTDTAVLIGMAYVYLPLMVLPLFAAIDRFDMRLLEAGYDLYATRWQVLAPGDPAHREAGDHRGVHSGVCAVAGGLCHAARAGRGQEHDDREFHRIAVSGGAELAAGGGAFSDAAGDRDGGVADLCAGREPGEQSAWLSGGSRWRVFPALPWWQ
jgi:spermidine/putrescine transport system permease protein